MALDWQPKNIGVVFKISERCNIACTYCYFFFGGDESYKGHPVVVPVDVTHGLTRFVREGIDDYGIESVSVILHGGEPMMMKPQRFDEMCQTLRDGLEAHCRLRFGMQTNAMLVNDKWVDLFEKHQVGVGVSMDGPKAINDEARLDHQGRGTYDRVVRGLRQLQDAASKRRISPVGALCVVDPRRDGGEIYRHFVDELGIRFLNFLPLDLHHGNVTPEVVDGTLEYMVKVFQEWTRDNQADIRIRFFSELVSAFLSDNSMGHIGAARSEIHQLMTVSSDGTLGAEDDIRTLHPRFADVGLNVKTASMRELFSTPQWREMADCVHTPPPGCSECEWWRVCRGGHAPHRYDEANGLNNPSIYCDALKEVYTEVASYLISHGLKLDDLMRRLTGTLEEGEPAPRQPEAPEVTFA
ncbi:MAG: radical SAM protein [Pseudomonadota bacterium]